MLTTQEQIEERFDEKFVNNNVQIGATLWIQHIDAIKKVKSFIHTIRESDRAEMVKMIVGMESQYQSFLDIAEAVSKDNSRTGTEVAIAFQKVKQKHDLILSALDITKE